MSILINILRVIGIALSTVLWSFIVMPVSLVGLKELGDAAARTWARSLMIICGIRVRVIGLERIPQNRAVVYVGNHLSHMDGVAFVANCPEYPRFVAKKILGHIPFFGWTMRAMGHIMIDRKNRESAISAIESAGRKYAGKVSVFFFAEGTRSLDGKLAEFKKGAFAYAIASGQPIVPAIIRGGRDILPPHTRMIRPGPMEVIFAEPVEVSGYTRETMGDLMAAVRTVILQHDPSGSPQRSGGVTVQAPA